MTWWVQRQPASLRRFSSALITTQPSRTSTNVKSLPKPPRCHHQAAFTRTSRRSTDNGHQRYSRRDIGRARTPRRPYRRVFAPRRVQLNDSLADYFYGISEVLKQQGKRAEASEAHSLANKHWSAVCTELPDDTTT